MADRRAAGIAPPKLLVDARAAAEMLDISERLFHCRRKDASFPRPVDLSSAGGRLVRWRVSDLQAYVASLPAADAAPEPERLRGRRYRSGQRVDARSDA